MKNHWVVLSLFVGFVAHAASDFQLKCDDGSGHWRKIWVDVNHPTSEIRFDGDGVGATPEVWATTRISTQKISIEGEEKLEWTYAFEFFRGMEGSIVFKGIDEGDHQLSDGSAEVKIKSEAFQYLNDSYRCQVR